jgi:hypothetical protein
VGHVHAEIEVSNPVKPQLAAAKVDALVEHRRAHVLHT